MKARENPFATSRVLKMRYQLLIASWDDLETRLATLGHRAAIVGPHGSGKTTLLEDVAGRLSLRGWNTRWLRLNEENPRLPSSDWPRVLAELGAQDCILFDGAEQLSWLAWTMFKRRSRHVGGLVVTAHRPGLLPTLHTCATHPGLLASIAGNLMGRRDAMPEEDLRDLFCKHRGNLRDALRELYDRWAQRESSAFRRSVGGNGEMVLTKYPHLQIP